MNIILVSGNQHKTVLSYAKLSAAIINPNALTLSTLHDYLGDKPPTYKMILITDSGLNKLSHLNFYEIERLLISLRKLTGNDSIKVTILSRNYKVKDELSYLEQKFSNLHIQLHPYVRLTLPMLLETASVAKNSSIPIQPVKQKPTFQAYSNSTPEETIGKKKSFFEKLLFKSKDETADSSMSKEFDRVSRVMNRVIAFTGHRGSGVTSSIVNIASEANKRGLSTIIVDLDVHYRTMNLYFNKFHNQSKIDELVNASLFRTMARPQEFMTTAFHIKDNLWLTSLGYSFTDKLLFEQYFHSDKLIALLSVLRGHFNLVLLDMPLEIAGKMQDVLIHIDSIGLCVSNNIYSIVTLFKNMEASLSLKNISYINAKSKLIVTKYNAKSRFQGEIFTPEAVNDVLISGLNEQFIYPPKLAGYIPFIDNFDSQIESDLPLVYTNKEVELAYSNVLLRLLEGN